MAVRKHREKEGARTKIHTPEVHLLGPTAVRHELTLDESRRQEQDGQKLWNTFSLHLGKIR